jgi:hypothetical protein
VSGRWLASAIGIVCIAALVCVWGALCLMFWQGSWQLLYHPTAPITKTPASAGMAFESVEFGTGQNGLPQLTGWWIPGAPETRYTAIFFHGADGNLSGTVEALASLHAAKLNVLAFDYRGYGKSKFIHPGEAGWREDAESAIAYLRDTRHIPEATLVLVGSGLGANLALGIAADHRELAGVVLDDSLDAPADAIFHDPRARLVPASILVKDRWDSTTAAAKLEIPSLWIYRRPNGGAERAPSTFERARARKSIVWLAQPATAQSEYENALSRWIGDLRSDGESR